MRRPHAGALAPLLALCLVVGLVGVGLARGLAVGNLHNGLLATSFGLVGAALLVERPGHREGRLFLLAGALEAVVFLGRQIGQGSASAHDAWWGWLGVWPLALTLAALTWCVLCFPEGRVLSIGWQRLGIGLLAVAAGCSLLSALWPVEYGAAAVLTPPPFTLPGADAAGSVWRVVAHPLYVVLQLVWVVAVVGRWRASDDVVRRQLAVMLAVVAGSAVALLTGLAVAGTPRPGLLVATLIPLAAGWSLQRMSLARVIEQETEAGHLDGLTPRENEILDLMAQGFSNQAIAERLHLSIKTVEPVVSSVFTKLGLPPGSDSNRRVLAVVRYLHATPRQRETADGRRGE